MPLSLSQEAIEDKNKLRSDVVWIDFVEFIYPGEDAVRICSDNQVTTWNGHDWQPVDFVPPEIKESRNASIPDTRMAFSDVTQEISRVIDQYDGAIGAEVNIYTVLSTKLDSNVPEREENMEVLDANINHESVINLTLGAENLQDRKATPRRYLKNHGRTFLGSNKCGYVGEETECNLTLARCREIGNSKRYCGFPAVGNLGYIE